MKCCTPVYMRKIGFEVRCGKCEACMKTVQAEWYNRMLLECYSNLSLPLFLTLTYDSDHYVDNVNHCVKETQKYFKRLRRSGFQIRYFMAVERGTKKGRLHNHLIIWCKDLSILDFRVRWSILYERWGNGAVDCQQVRSPAALRYVAKYIVKNLIYRDTLANPEDVKDWEYSQDKVKLKGRQYTWSNKPIVGANGMQRWREIILHKHKWQNYSVNKLPPSRIKLIFSGKPYYAYMPSGFYKRVCKEIGIDLKELHVCQEEIVENVI